MKLTLRSPIVYVAGAAVFVALLVIARPVLYPAANPAEQSSNPSVASAGPLPVVPVVDLDLDRLRVAGRALGEVERDPFRFRPKAPPPAPRVQAPPPVFAPPVPVGPPPVPAIPLRLIGFIDFGDRRLATFGDAHGNTFSGKEGDVLEGRYRLLRVGPNSVDIANLDGSGRQTIRMTGQ
jgi:hypothetical protein